MYSSILLQFLLVSILAPVSHGQEFVFSEHLRLDGYIEISPDGSAIARKVTSLFHRGQVFYAQPLKMKSSQLDMLSSFSTSFVFSLNPEVPGAMTEDISFVISSSKRVDLYIPGQQEQAEKGSSFVLITFKIDRDSKGVEHNHLEVNVNGLFFGKHGPLGYYRHSSDQLTKLGSVARGWSTQVWLDYDGKEKVLNISIAPVSSSRAMRPSFSVPLDIVSHVSEDIYVGISSNGPAKHLSSSSCYLLGWSFKVNGIPPSFDLSGIFKFRPKLESFHDSGDGILNGPICSCLMKFISNCSLEFQNKMCSEVYKQLQLKIAE